MASIIPESSRRNVSLAQAVAYRQLIHQGKALMNDHQLDEQKVPTEKSKQSIINKKHTG